MRALFDPSILISSLLAATHPDSTIGLIVAAAVRRSFVLMLPAEAATEILDAVRDSLYLTAQIPMDVVHNFVRELQDAADVLPALSVVPPAVTRDPDDDYLLAQAEAGAMDYLVSGDKDLHALKDGPFPFEIVSPAEFLAIFREAGLV